MEEYVQFTMRMESNLYEQLKESAKKNKRSVAKELEYLTDFHINQKTTFTMPDNVAKEFFEWMKKSPEFNQMLKDIESQS